MKKTSLLWMVFKGYKVIQCFAACVICQIVSISVQAQNVANPYTGNAGGSLRITGNWGLGVLPVVGQDVVFAGATGIKSLTGGDLAVGSLNVTANSGTHSIRNNTSTASHSHLTLGGAGNLGNSVSGTAADLVYAASGSEFNLRGDNGGGGTGVLMLILGQSGNFNIAGTSTLSCGISDGGNACTMTKTGAGKLTLSGVNTYTGNTTVNAGTLALAEQAGLMFVVSDISNTRITGTGTVTLDGDFTIDTTAVTTAVSSGAWNLVDVAQLTESFGESFRVMGAGWVQVTNVWSKIDGMRLWTFTESTGMLAYTTLAGGTVYATWVGTIYHLSGGNEAFDCDYDQDGIANGLEWIFGGDPTRNDRAAIEPGCSSGAAGGLTLVFNRESTSQAGTTLVVEWGTELASFSHSIDIGNNDVAANGSQPTVDLDAPAVGKVTVNIPAANAAGGKLFARIKASR